MWRPVRRAGGQKFDSLSGPLAALAGRLSERSQYPPRQWDKTTHPAVTPVREFLVGDVRPGLVATFVAMALILLIACVNVAMLVLGQVGARATERVRVPGRPELDDTSTYMRVVTPDYFQTMGIEVRQGRGSVPTDADNPRRVVIINDAMAAKYFSGQNPIGRIVNTGFDDSGEDVIGVVRNVAEGELTRGAEPARYMLYPHAGNGVLPAVTYVVRAHSPGDLPALAETKALHERMWRG
jgi:hypothetical protein